MRRIVNAAFESVNLQSVRWPAIIISAVVFGIMHGSLWFPGIVAGIAYGAVAVKTGKIGESVAAHATTNTLIAIQVLLLDQWQLW
jgi:CAAX prenyl protease-like protein